MRLGRRHLYHDRIPLGANAKSSRLSPAASQRVSVFASTRRIKLQLSKEILRVEIRRICLVCFADSIAKAPWIRCIHVIRVPRIRIAQHHFANNGRSRHAVTKGFKRRTHEQKFCWVRTTKWTSYLRRPQCALGQSHRQNRARCSTNVASVSFTFVVDVHSQEMRSE